MSTSLAVALIALGGVVMAQLVSMGENRKQRSEDRRVELMRTLRWAGELATKDDEASRDMGLSALEAVTNHPDLAAADAALANAIATAVLAESVVERESAAELVYEIPLSQAASPNDLLTYHEGTEEVENDGDE